MTVTDPRAAFGALLREMATDPQVVAEIVDAARAHSPELALLPAVEGRRQLAALLATVRAPDVPGAWRFGADRAEQGVSLAGLLRAVQAGRRRVLDLAISRGREAGLPDTVLLEGLPDLDRYADALERALVDGHHSAVRELLRPPRAEGDLRLLRRLLRGEAAAIPAAELARYGLRAEAECHLLVAEAADPVTARMLARRLRRCGGVAGVVDGRLVALVPRLPSGAAQWPELVVAAPLRPLRQAPLMHELAVAGLRCAGPGLRGLHPLVELAGEIALAAQPVLAELLGDTLLGALDPGDEFHRELAATALAYLDHGRRLDQTATALHVHPNTVRYRLHRLEAITGMSPTLAEPGARWSVPQTVRWWWALRTWLRRP